MSKTPTKAAKAIDWAVAKMKAGTPFKAVDVAAMFGITENYAESLVRIARHEYNSELHTTKSGLYVPHPNSQTGNQFVVTNDVAAILTGEQQLGKTINTMMANTVVDQEFWQPIVAKQTGISMRTTVQKTFKANGPTAQALVQQRTDALLELIAATT